MNLKSLKFSLLVLLVGSTVSPVTQALTLRDVYDIGDVVKKSVDDFKANRLDSREEVEEQSSPTKTGLQGEWRQVNFEAYSALINCNDRAASMVWMDATIDNGNVARDSAFHYTSKLPRYCQPKSLKTFSGDYNGLSFDRGHLLSSNGFDSSPIKMEQANIMINVVPQVNSTNRSGSWREIEKRLECYRTPKYIGMGSSLKIIAGPIWGNKADDDYFVSTHGVRTPTSLYKIAVFNNNGQTKTYAWIFPNTYKEGDKVNALIDRYLTTPSAIQQQTGITQMKQLVPVNDWNVRQLRSPDYLSGCDLS